MQYEDVEPQRMDCDGDSTGLCSCCPQIKATDARIASVVLCRGGGGPWPGGNAGLESKAQLLTAARGRVGQPNHPDYGSDVIAKRFAATRLDSASPSAPVAAQRPRAATATASRPH